MIQKVILRRLLPGFYVLPFFAFLLGLARHAYRAKELLVCWLLFCSLFAVLALMFLGAVLAFHAGRNLVNWVRAANTVIPELVVCLAELPQEAISGPGILVADRLKTVEDPYASVDVLGVHSCLRIEVVSSVEGGVSKRTDRVLRAP